MRLSSVDSLHWSVLHDDDDALHVVFSVVTVCIIL